MSGYVVKPMILSTTKGREVEVPGLGLLKNGIENEISEEQAEYFRNYNMVPVTKENQDGQFYTEWVQGPTVAEYFKDTIWVEVTTKKEEKKSEGGSK